MDTNQLTRALAADNSQRSRPVGFVLALALLAAAPVSILMFVSELGVRPDVMTAMHNPFFDLKFGVTLALAIVNQTTTAQTERNVTAGGTVSFTAMATDGSTATATASAAGAPASMGSGSGSVSSVDGTVSTQRSFANTQADNNNVMDSKGDSSTPSASTSDGQVSVAAAIAINIGQETTLATIPDGVTIGSTTPLTVTAGGLLTLSAAQAPSGTAMANGSATSCTTVDTPLPARLVTKASFSLKVRVAAAL